MKSKTRKNTASTVNSTLKISYPHITSTLNLNWPELMVFVRHGESEGNKHGRAHMAKVLKRPTYMYDLTELGEEQAKHTGEYIEKHFGLTSFDAHFTSTYLRAHKTFDIMFNGVKKQGRQVTPIVDARVNEITRGFAGLMSEEEQEALFPHDRASFRLNGWFHNIPLSGQSCVQIEHVIQTFLAYLREGCAGKRVIVVGHGTWINLCCRILMGRSIEESERLHAEGYYKNASVTVFRRERSCKVGMGPKYGSRLFLTDENVVPWHGKIKGKSQA